MCNVHNSTAPGNAIALVIKKVKLIAFQLAIVLWAGLINGSGTPFGMGVPIRNSALYHRIMLREMMKGCDTTIFVPMGT